MKTAIETNFNKDILILPNVEKEVENIIFKLREDIHGVLKRNGAVVGISGGIILL